MGMSINKPQRASASLLVPILTKFEGRLWFKLYSRWRKGVCFHWRKMVWFSLPFTPHISSHNNMASRTSLIVRLNILYWHIRQQ